MTAAEVADFRAALHGDLGRLWPSPRVASEPDAGGARLGAVWDAAVAQGWTALGRLGALDAALEATAELGRCACPLPLMDAYVAARLCPELDESIRPVVAVDPARVVEATEVATHVLLLPRERGGAARLCTVAERTATPGLARPAWAAVTPGPQVDAVPVDAAAVEEAKILLRLGLAVRAMAAAEATHRLAVEHAKTRHAFGKPIGAFQAVSHRCANCEIDVAAARGLIEEAVRLHAAGAAAWPLASELAVAHAARAARRVQLGAHHTLAAIGFFEEHEGPWLFRRVHADVLRLAELPISAGEPADVLLEQGVSLPPLELGEAAERFRSELAAFLEGGETSDRSLAAAGYLEMAYGGRDASVEEQMVLHEELRYRGVEPNLLAAASLIGGAIVRHGTEEQKERFLPLIAAGRLPFYLAYSESSIGSDLAGLRTRAVRDGDDWVIDGQKLWGTNAHRAEWCWLAARTGPDAEVPHRGITVFLFSVPRPGWQLQQHTSLADEISCTTFFDGVRVSDADRVGEVNGGWTVITDALASERMVMGGVTAHVHRQLDELLAQLRRDPERSGPRGSAARSRLTELAARLQAARILVNHSLRATSAGEGSRLEAPMAKIVGSEVQEDLCEAALDLLGPQATLAGSTFELGLRLSIKSVVGGGTNDIQRNLIARSLGLPR
jgi:alkylation response protein AidB-like acyl-CoA dehydrogenase